MVRIPTLENVKWSIQKYDGEVWTEFMWLGMGDKGLAFVNSVMTLWVPKLTYLLTYLITPRSRVLLEKLNGFQLVQNFPTFYGTRRFITAFTSARHLSLS